MQHINMEEFANGAFSEQVNRAIRQVTENIQDPNTDATATRKVTVTIAFKPNEQRNFVTTGVITKVTTAPPIGTVTAFSMGKDLTTGEVEAVEIGKQIPGQMSIDDMSHPNEPVTVIDGRAYDQSTGEIYDSTPHEGRNVVDLRAARQA